MERCKAVARSDNVLRINFLYQAAHSALVCSPANPSVARFYLQTLVRVRQKNQVRLDPSIKRTLCKKCNMLLIMGVTATTRLAGGRRKHVIVKCLDCGQMKRYRTDDKEYSLWSTRPDAWVCQPRGIFDDAQTPNGMPDASVTSDDRDGKTNLQNRFGST